MFEWLNQQFKPPLVNASGIFKEMNREKQDCAVRAINNALQIRDFMTVDYMFDICLGHPSFQTNYWHHCRDDGFFSVELIEHAITKKDDSYRVETFLAFDQLASKLKEIDRHSDGLVGMIVGNGRHWIGIHRTPIGEWYWLDSVAYESIQPISTHELNYRIQSQIVDDVKSESHFLNIPTLLMIRKVPKATSLKDVSAQELTQHIKNILTNLMNHLTSQTELYINIDSVVQELTRIQHLVESREYYMIRLVYTLYLIHQIDKIFINRLASRDELYIRVVQPIFTEITKTIWESNFDDIESLFRVENEYIPRLKKFSRFTQLDAERQSLYNDLESKYKLLLDGYNVSYYITQLETQILEVDQKILELDLS